MSVTIIKNITLATCLVLAVSQAAKAQTAELLPKTISAQSVSETEIAQNRRTRTRRRSRTINKKTYFGLGVGGFFPGDEISIPTDNFAGDGTVDFGSGFALNVFGGYRLSKYVAGELEISAGFGNVEFDNVPDQAILDDLDIDYTALGFYLTPRFELPLLNDKFKLYAAPGIGFSTVNTDIDTDINLDGEEDELTSDSGFSYQIKTGAAYNASDRISIFGQARYNSFALGELDNLNSIAVEVGASF